MIVLVVLLGAQLAEAPASQEASPSTSPPGAAQRSGWQDECRTLVDKGALEIAADCYRHAAAADADAALALALADVLTRVQLREPMVEQPTSRPPPSFSSTFTLRDFGAERFVISGRAEVVVLGVVDGVGVGIGMAVMAVSTLGSSAAALALALPLFGAVGGFGSGLTAMLVLDEHLSDGDVHLIRAGLVVAAFEGVTTAMFLVTAGMTSSFLIPIVAGASLTAFALTVGTTAAAASLFDVDPSAPSLGLSFGWIGGVVGLLAARAVDVRSTPQQHAQLALLATSLGVHVGLAGGLALAPALGASRGGILLVDAGAVVGLLGGSALAFGLKAPNPLLGYGSIATGTLVGAAVGVVGAALLGPGDGKQQAALPIQFTPTVVASERTVAPGVALVVRLP